MTTKLVEPVLRELLESGDVKLDAFLLPGHVAVVIGKRSFDFLAEEYEISGVITGFEPVELLDSIYKLLQLLVEKKVAIMNDYTYMVKDEGNLEAQKLIEEYLEHHDDVTGRSKAYEAIVKGDPLPTPGIPESQSRNDAAALMQCLKFLI